MNTPLLKPTLDAKREDKDGAVFYRLSDPTTGREYRLYEVEYLIAQMLDGHTLLSDIAARVRDELKFDLSPNDLERFVRELESLGFLSGTGKPIAKAGDEPMALSADDIIDDADVADVDKMAVTDELERLVRSALLHVKQGMVAQARDYFLAAKKYAPSDEKVGTMLNHLDVVGEDDGPSDIEYLWKQAAVLYPELTQEIGPPGIGQSPIPVEEQRERSASARGRLLLAVSLLALCAAGFLAWEFVGRDLLRPKLQVETEKVRVRREHMLYEAEATEVGPRESFSHAFDKGGVVVDVLVKTGEQVQKGQLLARQKLSPAEEKQLGGMRQKRQAAEKAFLALAMEVEKVTAELNAKNDEAEKLRADVEALQKAIILKPANERAAAKKELAALKKAQGSAKKELAAAKKKVGGPSKAQARAKKGFDTAKAAEEAIMQKSPAAFLRSSAAGYVTSIAVEAGAKVEAASPVVTVADTTALRIRFKGPDRLLQALSADMPVKVSSRDSELSEARVAEVTNDGVIVETSDQEAGLVKSDKKTLKLVRETVENALIVAAPARLPDGAAYVVEQDVAVRHDVEWVGTRGREAVARSGLKPGDLVVIGPESALKQLKGERVEVKASNRSAEATP